MAVASHYDPYRLGGDEVFLQVVVAHIYESYILHVHR